MNMNPPMCSSTYLKKLFPKCILNMDVVLLNPWRKLRGILNIWRAATRRKGEARAGKLWWYLANHGGNCIDIASILPSSVVPGNTGKRQPPILQTSQDIYATGSAGAIQAVGAAQIFERSVEQNKLRCITY